MKRYFGSIMGKLILLLILLLLLNEEKKSHYEGNEPYIPSLFFINI